MRLFTAAVLLTVFAGAHDRLAAEPRTTFSRDAIVAAVRASARAASPSGAETPLRPAAQGNQKRSWIGRHQVLTGALVGAGVGVTAASTMDNEWFCHGGDDDCLFHGPGRIGYGAVFGAGLGALAGAVVGLLRR